ncbi:MerC domain-containing protein [Alteromonas oceanisediminis]|uniref:MerC domain-containing protein n=1 Tax=Alteromonas oceanisediminis TaxID=2836180 RepID=UPI001BDA755C|nr:MerC domain-containing protein [Alteromonas oceanisediminis]MBT0585955.1 MerC family mercury resistance protein [Alteromonas oceanisediminis]
MRKHLIGLADRFAIGLSALCVIHCMVLPILLVLLPAFSSLTFLSDEKFHSWLLFAVIPISAFAVLSGYLQHRHLATLGTALCGMTILLLVAFLGHDVFGEIGEVVFSVIGSVLIAYGHISNLKRRTCIASA